jgi:hypothetical protein
VSQYFKIVLLIILLSVATAGCTEVHQTSSDGPEMPAPEVIPDGSSSNEGENMDFETVDPGSLEGSLKEQFGGHQADQGMLITEDSGYKYVFVSAGRKPTDGYYIRVGSLIGFEKLIMLNALLYSPCETDNVEAVATYPSLLIRIPADEREVILFLTDTRNTYLG